MKRIVLKNKSSLKVNKSYEGETIEQKIERIINNNEPIEDIAPTIYQPRKAGIEPQYNIRTDRFDLGIDAMDTLTASMMTRRQEYHGMMEESLGSEPTVDTAEK